MKQAIAKAVNWLADRTGIRVLPDRLPHPKGSNVETLSIPGYYQTQGHTCGYVAGLMVLHFFRPDVPAEKFYERVRPHVRWGVSRQRLMDALCLYGVRVKWKRDLDFNGIVDAIDDGRPIAVVVRTRNADVNHWVVVYGYGKKPNRVFVAGELPFQGQSVYPYSMFRTHYWENPGFGLVCAGPKDD